MHLSSQWDGHFHGSGPPTGPAGPWRKDDQKGAPWIKVGLWKMGTRPNSGEGDVIPAEANQNTPLGSQ